MICCAEFSQFFKAFLLGGIICFQHTGSSSEISLSMYKLNKEIKSMQ